LDKATLCNGLAAQYAGLSDAAAGISRTTLPPLQHQPLQLHRHARASAEWNDFNSNANNGELNQKMNHQILFQIFKFSHYNECCCFFSFFVSCVCFFSFSLTQRRIGKIRNGRIRSATRFGPTGYGKLPKNNQRSLSSRNWQLMKQDH
jgi:hypothetical protein